MKRKSSLITKLIILTLSIYAIVTIVALRPKIDAQREQADTLTKEVHNLRVSNGAKQYDIDTMNSDEGVMRIARERLNLVMDGEMVYIDKSK